MSLVAALLLALAPRADAPRADVAFQAQPVKQGQKVTITSASEMKMTMTVKMGGQELQKMELPSKEEVACVVTVPAADAKGATAAKLAFGKCPKVEPSPLGPQAAEHACSEKTFEMKRGDAGFAAATELEKDAKDMTGWVCDMALTAPLASVLAGKTVKQGDAIEVPADVAQRAFALYASDAKVKKMTLTLQGERNEGGVDAGVFKVAATMTVAPEEGAPGNIEIEVTGDMVVGKASSAVVASALNGTIKMDASMDQGGQAIVMEGRGNSTWKYASKVE
jgi:hypothetical protein